MVKGKFEKMENMFLKYFTEIRNSFYETVEFSMYVEKIEKPLIKRKIFLSISFKKTADFFVCMYSNNVGTNGKK